MADCDCESSTQSDHPSPGIVRADEFVIRLVRVPGEVDDDGALRPTSIDRKDLKRLVDEQPQARACSVDREAHASTSKILEKATALREPEPSLLSEVWAFRGSVEKIRALKIDDGSRALCVVDRAEIDDPAHAEFWGGRTGRPDSILRKIRADLASLLIRDRRLV